MNHINKDTLKYLTPTEPWTAHFYHLPKIHKAGNPGRPIVSSCGAPTERISEYVHHHLCPLVVQIPSYLRDTTDFLRKLSTLEMLPPGSILVILDVSSLYTNIPHNEGVAACKEALETCLTLAPPTNYLVGLIQQILTLNNFTFNGEHYLQTQGTAMGTRMAPSYARIALVVTYRPGLTKLSSIVRKHLPILHISEKLRKAIPNPLVAHKRPPNLRDLLVRAEVKTPTPPTPGDNAPCGSRRCKTCQLIKRTNTVTSNTTGRRYTIRNQFTCKAKNIVYMISCDMCNMQYVGETENALHIRMNGHRSDITTKKLDKPVAAHFNQPNHSYEDLRVIGIEKVKDRNNSRKWKKLRERYWIFELRTLTPEGLNIED